MGTTSLDAQPADTGSERPVIELFRGRPYWRWATAATLIQLGPLMSPLAFMLASLRYTGGPAVAGMLVGVSMAPTLLLAPTAGRLMDRIGTATWTPRLIGIGAVIRVLLAAGFMLRLPSLALAAIAFLGAASTCGVSGATRALLQNTVPKHLVGTALSLNAVSSEIVVITAPFLVTVCAIAGPGYPLMATGVVSLASGALLWRRPRARQAATGKGGRRPLVTERRWELMRNRQFIFWVLVGIGFGQVMGSADLTVLPVAVAHGGGITRAAELTAILGGASAATGLAYAWFAKRLHLSLASRGVILALLMSVSLEIIGFSGGWLALMLAFALLGLWTSPLNAVKSEAPGEILPDNRLAEGFSVQSSAGILGFAMASWLLTAVSFHTVLFVGPAMAVVAVAAAPFLLGRSSAATPDRLAR